MRKPVDKLEFWQRRINESRNVRDTVYRTSAREWYRICEIHNEIISNHFNGEESVLDAGCAYGRACEFLPDNYVGVDFVPEFIELAHELYPDKEFVCCDLTDLPLEWTEKFDWVVCISVRQMIIGNLNEAHWDRIKTELKRVARKGILILEYTTQYPGPDYEVVSL